MREYQARIKEVMSMTVAVEAEGIPFSLWLRVFTMASEVLKNSFSLNIMCKENGLFPCA